MERLRGPDGCPWDHEQTYGSLRRYLVEECYEVADAIDRGDFESLREELGDLLLQIVFLSRIAEEEGRFDVGDVARAISEKLVRRHPHVFGGETVADADDVARNWEAIKRREKTAPGAASRLDGVPASLPPLAKARILGDRAARVGFDWPDAVEVLDKLHEELGELREALATGNPRHVESELGDFLFSGVMLARKASIDPEAALEATNRKFRRRFGWIERELNRRGVSLGEAGLDLMESLWDEAKRGEGEH